MDHHLITLQLSQLQDISVLWIYHSLKHLYPASTAPLHWKTFLIPVHPSSSLQPPSGHRSLVFWLLFPSGGGYSPLRFKSAVLVSPWQLSKCLSANSSDSHSTSWTLQHSGCRMQDAPCTRCANCTWKNLQFTINWGEKRHRTSEEVSVWTQRWQNWHSSISRSVKPCIMDLNSGINVKSYH